jgi:hypothetical protein
VAEKVNVEEAEAQMAPKDDMFDATPIEDEAPPASAPASN